MVVPRRDESERIYIRFESARKLLGSNVCHLGIIKCSARLPFRGRGGHVRTLRGFALLGVLASLVPSAAVASPVVIGFESLTDGEAATTQFPGLAFSNALVLTAGVSLDDAEFPPFAGSNVATDSGGPIEIDFAQPVINVGGYFTYAQPLLLRAFNASHILVGSVSSAFSNNEALSGDVGSLPNELLGFVSGNISSVTITGAPLGGSFTLDNLTYTSQSVPVPTSVPEPATFTLVLAGAAAAFARRRRSNPTQAVRAHKSSA
jgi:hypothetical protein